jgi:hypothetical protein
VRPSVWYNGYDGLKVGMVLSGDYLLTKHVFELGAWSSTGLGQAYTPSLVKNMYSDLSFVLDYKTSLNRFIKKSNIYVQVKSLDGLDGLTIGLERKSNNDRTRFYTHLKAMLRDMPQDTVYLINSHEWGYQKLNSALHAGAEHNARYRKGTWNFQVNLRAAALTNDYDYSFVNTSAINKHELGRFGINTRFFAQMGFGTRLPQESMLYAAGANNEELMNNKYTRSMGFIPPDWGNYGPVTNHFTAGGGLGLRGFSGYLLAMKNSDGLIEYNYKGTSGFSASAEIEFGKLFRKFNPKFLKNTIKIQPYLFGDCGIININAPGKIYRFSPLMADAGIGTTFSIMRWGRLYGLKPLVIRFDMPLFLNRLPFAETDYVQFRWMIGINRAF